MGTLPTMVVLSARAARGAANGLVATAVMTGVMVAARRAGLVDPPSPEAVVTGALEKADVAYTVRPPGILPPPWRQAAGRHVSNISSHLVYGSVLGTLSARAGDR